MKAILKETAEFTAWLAITTGLLSAALILIFAVILS